MKRKLRFTIEVEAEATSDETLLKHVLNAVETLSESNIGPQPVTVMGQNPGTHVTARFTRFSQQYLDDAGRVLEAEEFVQEVSHG